MSSSDVRISPNPWFGSDLDFSATVHFLTCFVVVVVFELGNKNDNNKTKQNKTKKLQKRKLSKPCADVYTRQYTGPNQYKLHSQNVY